MGTAAFGSPFFSTKTSFSGFKTATVNQGAADLQFFIESRSANRNIFRSAVRLVDKAKVL
jgi:hypothetical protein